MAFGDLERNLGSKKESHSRHQPIVTVTEIDAPQSGNDDDGPPDGGVLAWLQCLSSILMNTVAWGYPSMYGVYQLYYTETLHLPPAQISWVGSVQTFLTYLMCTPAGRLADAGYVMETTCLGCFLTVLGSLTTSFCTSYWQIFLAQGVCTGLGNGMVYMPAMAVLSSYFDKKRSIALAISAIGTSIGSSVFPAIIQYLIPQVGFAWAVRACALVVLVLLVIATLLLKPRLAPRKAGPFIEWAAFKEPPYVLLASGCFLVFYALYFGYFYLNIYATDIAGFSTTSSALLLIISSVASIPTRPLSGWLADKSLGSINTYILSTMALGIVGFTWIAVTSKVDMYLFAVFFGLANGGSQGAFGAAIASLTTEPAKMGTRFGMICTLIGFATLAGPPTAGAIIDKCGGRYLWAQIWAGGVTILGALTVGAARCWLTGPTMLTKV